MPTFDFLCPSCKHTFEALLLANQLAVCPKCNAAPAIKLPSAPAVKVK